MTPALLRAAEAAGLVTSVDLITTPLSSDPPDDRLARADALPGLATTRHDSPPGAAVTWISH